MSAARKPTEVVLEVSRTLTFASAVEWPGWCRSGKTPDDALLPGGMGLRFDWAMLNGHVHASDWILAGGLTPENVIPAIMTTGARMVDVSSGVETAPGVKDVDKIAAFLKAVAQC